MSMRLSLIPGFLCRFAVIYGLLIVPWPGWNELYGQYFTTLGQLTFTRTEGKEIVLFESQSVHRGPASFMTKMTVGNRDLLDIDGNGVGRIVELDTRSIGWVPTALTMALVLATPIRWQRRIKALLQGLILIQGYILISLQACIWNKSAELSLLKLSPFWKRLAEGLDYTLLTQLGTSFSVPVLIWILVTFRRQDAKLTQ